MDAGMQALRVVPQWARRGATISSVFTAIGVGTWALSLPAIDPRQATDLGLVAVLPPAFFLALGLVVIGFMTAVNERPLPTWALLFNVLAVIVMIHGLRALVADGTYLATTWVHVGFVDVISRTGGLLPELDARFSWPGFFALVAFVADAADVDLVDVIPWVPLAVNVLLLPCLMLVYRALSSDLRIAWISAFVFFATNWIGQDYLAPQAFAFITYVCVLGLVLTWFARGHGAHAATSPEVPSGAPPATHDHAESVSSGVQRTGLMVVLILMLAALVPSHQLTPFALLGALAALAMFRMTWLRALPMLLAVLIGAWISYMTVPFLAGHIGGLLAQVGSTEAVATENVAARVAGSSEHMVVVYLRLGATVAFWALAALGVIRRVRRGQWDWSALLLAGAPIGLFFLQSYGGEMLQRIYLFSLPFMAFFVAALFVPRWGRIGRAANLTLAATLAVMLVALTLTRFGNERIDLISSQELEGVAALYAIAPPRSSLITVNNNSSVRSQALEEYRHYSVRYPWSVGDVDTVIYVLENIRQPAFLLLTRSQQAWAEVMEGMPAGRWDALANELAARGDVRVVFQNSDAVIYRLLPTTGARRD
jgi:hypothetical protein